MWENLDYLKIMIFNDPDIWPPPPRWQCLQTSIKPELDTCIMLGVFHGNIAVEVLTFFNFVMLSFLPHLYHGIWLFCVVFSCFMVFLGFVQLNFGVLVNGLVTLLCPCFLRTSMWMSRKNLKMAPQWWMLSSSSLLLRGSTFPFFSIDVRYGLEPYIHVGWL